ncbi:MAG: hypothetical protein NC299_03555 [Lachnospiraceae bacterium]|nr:hypothetical protein [Ruminococcus sp.]MCM1274426.1 hypothetical protein [Lachnospiraceae bacterium]
MKRIAFIGFAALLLVFVGFCASVPVVNDLHAKSVADGLAALPLPEDTRIAEKKSIADKLWGNGNGMQYFGALLLESGLPVEELQASYPDCEVRKQTGRRIEVVEHGNYTFKTEISSDGYYIVYALGKHDSPLIELYAELDLRGR